MRLRKKIQQARPSQLHCPGLTPVAAATDRRPARLQSIDLLRGWVMVLMTLDHTRGFFSSAPFSPTDLTLTFPALFATRWITDICAPVFFLLAGTGAFLNGSHGKTRSQLSTFLWTRGLWLVFLELTFLNWFAWTDVFSLHNFLAVVFWALGWSMVALAGLVWLPRWAIAFFGIGLCVGHNLCDSVSPTCWGSWAWLWAILYAGGGADFPGHIHLEVIYRLIPWTGVMALGYAVGPLFLAEAAVRRKWAVRAGFIFIALFLAVRGLNRYGDPAPWSVQKNAVFTAMSFVNCTKYPPSLDFLLMTFGPACLLLALLECDPPPWLKPIRLFGQVPLFFFLLHVPLIRVAAAATQSLHPPTRGGFGLLGVYIAWIIFVLVLYFPCHYYAAFRRRHKSTLLSYL